MTSRPTLVYIHGFNSSAQAFKAKIVSDHLSRFHPDKVFVCPQLPADPDRAMSFLERVVHDSPVEGFIGSSLGGFYAYYLSAKYEIPCALINPAVRPFELLHQYLGPQENPSTGERYHVSLEYLDCLKRYYCASPNTQRVKVWLQQDDEVLDYREALEYFGSECCVVSSGGGHGYVGYESIVGDQLQFLFSHGGG